jgi:hypothetical protein
VVEAEVEEVVTEAEEVVAVAAAVVEEEAVGYGRAGQGRGG